LKAYRGFRSTEPSSGSAGVPPVLKRDQDDRAPRIRPNANRSKSDYLVTVPEGLDIDESPLFKRELLHKPPRPKIVHPHVNDHWDVDRGTSDAKWIRIRQHAISHTPVSGVRFSTFVQDCVPGLSKRHQAITAAKRPGGNSAEANQEEKKDSKCSSHGSVSFCMVSRDTESILERPGDHEQCVAQQSCQLMAPGPMSQAMPKPLPVLLFI